MAKLPRAQLVDTSAAGHIEFGGGINVTGVVTATSFEGNTTGKAVDLSGSPNVVGAIITATTYRGSGSGITGLAGTSYIGQSTSFESAGTYNIDLSKGNVIHVDTGLFNGTATVGFSNTATGSGEIRVIAKNKCAMYNCRVEFNWPSNITWEGDGKKPPSIFNPRCNSIQEITLLTTDSGASWYGSESVRIDPQTTNVWNWGYDRRPSYFGQNYWNGTDDALNKYSSPISVGATYMSGPNPYSDFKDIQYGHYYALGLKNDGTLWSWGENQSGVLGRNCCATHPNVHVSSSPVQIGIGCDWASLGNANGSQPEQAGAIKNDGTMWIWGAGGSGFGNNTTNNYSIPIQIGHCMLHRWTCLGFSPTSGYALDDSGLMWAWGRNYQGQSTSGQLGVAPCNRSCPVKVCGNHCWKAVAAISSGKVAVRHDGTLWSWGCGHYGATGNSQWANGQSGFPCSPRQVGTDTNWKCVWGGEYNVAGLKGSSLWAWGNHQSGIIGCNTNEMHGCTSGGVSSPVAMWGGFHNNLKCIHFAGSTAVAVDCCGGLWAWGSNQDGKLAHNNTCSNAAWKGRSSPIRLHLNRRFGSVSGSMCHFSAFSATGDGGS